MGWRWRGEVPGRPRERARRILFLAAQSALISADSSLSARAPRCSSRCRAAPRPPRPRHQHRSALDRAPSSGRDARHDADHRSPADGRPRRTHRPGRAHAAAGRGRVREVREGPRTVWPLDGLLPCSPAAAPSWLGRRLLGLPLRRRRCVAHRWDQSLSLNSSTQQSSEPIFTRFAKSPSRARSLVGRSDQLSHERPWLPPWLSIFRGRAGVAKHDSCRRAV